MRKPSSSSSSPPPPPQPSTRPPSNRKDTNKKPTSTPCCTKFGLKRGPWTPDEDGILSNYIKKEGEGGWRTLPKRAGLLRCGKSCRLRWMNYLRPSVKRGRIAPDEEDMILRLHRLLGNRWSLIAGRIPGRTDNEIKNYWNTHLSKKLISQGIDPRTHKPLNKDNDDSASKQAKPSNPNHPKQPEPALSSSSVLQEQDVDSTSNGKLKFTAQLDDAHQKEIDYPQFSSFGNNLPNSEEEEDIHCGGDDTFSSFLNSLINEEAFAGQNQLNNNQQMVTSGGSDDFPDAAASSTTVGLYTGWQSVKLNKQTRRLRQPFSISRSLSRQTLLYDT